jgi:hypothetical protein
MKHDIDLRHGPRDGKPLLDNDTHEADDLVGLILGGMEPAERVPMVRGLVQATRALAAGKDPAHERVVWAFERAVRELRECTPDAWPDLVFRAVKPICQASGFARTLAYLLLATVEMKGDQCTTNG